MTTTQGRTRQLLKLPPTQWNAWVSRHLEHGDKELLYDIENELLAMVQHTARLALYLNARGSLGRSDFGHDRAVKTMNRKIAQIRKVLGYAYPKSGCFNF